MSDPTPNKPKVTLEDLLRLKRHERPKPEYWARFDRELNEKVWRTLVQPAESRWGWFTAFSQKHLRWMAAGAVSVLTLALAWPGHYVMTPNHTTVASNAPVVKVAALNPAPAISVSQIQVAPRVATVAAATDEAPVNAQPKYVVAAVTETSNPAGFNKVPAMLAFAMGSTEQATSNPDTLSNPAFPVHLRGSAY